MGLFVYKMRNYGSNLLNQLFLIYFFNYLIKVIEVDQTRDDGYD
ncbi:hypothetical protein SPAR126_0312 [Streptococcus pneumoniae 8190-05]|nr:hypothetical protein SPAR126_0312 [Streptococcus pneumoniae 8190-05]